MSKGKMMKRCELCGAANLRMKKRDHFLEAHPEYEFEFVAADDGRPNMIRCTICGEAFPMRRDSFRRLIRHYQEKHPERLKAQGYREVISHAPNVEVAAQLVGYGVLARLQELYDENVRLKAELQQAWDALKAMQSGGVGLSMEKVQQILGGTNPR
ncbi:MAG: hypothetical protein WC551_08295 [Patescibacteria group bacterium]